MTATRNIVSILVAWCPDCRYWLPIEEAGGLCFGDPDCPRKLVKRRKWVCKDCGCSYQKKADADNHTCGECY